MGIPLSAILSLACPSALVASNAALFIRIQSGIIAIFKLYHVAFPPPCGWRRMWAGGSYSFPGHKIPTNTPRVLSLTETPAPHSCHFRQHVFISQWEKRRWFYCVIGMWLFTKIYLFLHNSNSGFPKAYESKGKTWRVWLNDFPCFLIQELKTFSRL